MEPGSSIPSENFPGGILPPVPGIFGVSLQDLVAGIFNLGPYTSTLLLDRLLTFQVFEYVQHEYQVIVHFQVHVMNIQHDYHPFFVEHNQPMKIEIEY